MMLVASLVHAAVQPVANMATHHSTVNSAQNRETLLNFMSNVSFYSLYRVTPSNCLVTSARRAVWWWIVGPLRLVRRFVAVRRSVRWRVFLPPGLVWFVVSWCHRAPLSRRA